MFADYHIHTHYSDDSVYPMETVVQGAIRIGLKEICITDHVDYGIKLDWNCPEEIQYRDGMAIANVNYPLYEAEIKHLQNKYKGKINIKMGMEFGMQIHTISQFEKLFQRYSFDFIILSIHQIENKEFWTQDFQYNRTQQEYNERYYQEMLALVKNYKNYSVLGHMDLIVRYDKEGVYPFEQTKDIIAEILKTVIADDKGIEVNTSNIRYGLKDLTPSKAILNLYRDLGGKIITIGSDSHQKEHLGSDIKETKQTLIGLGFGQHCTYDKMIPTYHSMLE